MSAIASQEIVAKNAELWSIRARDWAAAQDRDERQGPPSSRNGSSG
jgi:hypothetical protein